MINFGRTIKKYREKLYVKQSDLALKVCVTPTYLSAVENNRKEPSLTLLNDICKALRVPKEVFFWDAVEAQGLKLKKSDRRIVDLAKAVVEEYYHNLA